MSEQSGSHLSPTRHSERPGREDFSDPWSWRPSAREWYAHLAAAALQWYPAAELALDAEPLIERVREAAAQQERWLLQPCVGTLLQEAADRRLERDLQLALWVEAHGAPTGAHVQVPRELEVWTPAGSAQVAAGSYALSELAGLVARDWPWPIALDIWCQSLPSPPEDSWPAARPLTDADAADLERDTRLFLRALTAAQRYLEPLVAWMTAVTTVVVPLRPQAGAWRSACSADIPGLIFLDLQDGMQILEGLVHESAHRHLFLAEAAGPLVDPAHTGTYSSPLRADPRPLRGILFAYHALAYICAFYADAIANGLGVSQAAVQLPMMRQKLLGAEQTLVDNRRFLTVSGDRFLDQTLDIGSYSQRVSDQVQT